jgi:hypothetical protein
MWREGCSSGGWSLVVYSHCLRAHASNPPPNQRLQMQTVGRHTLQPHRQPARRPQAIRAPAVAHMAQHQMIQCEEVPSMPVEAHVLRRIGAVVRAQAQQQRVNQLVAESVREPGQPAAPTTGHEARSAGGHKVGTCRMRSETPAGARQACPQRTGMCTPRHPVGLAGRGRARAPPRPATRRGGPIRVRRQGAECRCEW